jgi:hypothetical protein
MSAKTVVFEIARAQDEDSRHSRHSQRMRSGLDSGYD